MGPRGRGGGVEKEKEKEKRGIKFSVTGPPGQVLG